MSAYEVSIEKGAFSRNLTPQQRAFAETTINCIATSGDPFNYRDQNGYVKALDRHYHGCYAFKPHTHLRHGFDLEIRIVFKESKFRKLVIVIMQVCPRDEAYARR